MSVSGQSMFTPRSKMENQTNSRAQQLGQEHTGRPRSHKTSSFLPHDFNYGSNNHWGRALRNISAIWDIEFGNLDALIKHTHYTFGFIHAFQKNYSN